MGRRISSIATTDQSPPPDQHISPRSATWRKSDYRVFASEIHNDSLPVAFEWSEWIPNPELFCAVPSVPVSFSPESARVLPLFLNALLRVVPRPLPTFHQDYITWHDGINCANLFILFSSISLHCHARHIMHRNPSEVHREHTLWAVRKGYSGATGWESKKVTEGGLKQGRLSLGQGKWDQTRDCSSLCIPFDVRAHGAQNCLDHVLEFCRELASVMMSRTLGTNGLCQRVLG